MKHLLLLRHAKSSWKDAECDDFDRPLNKRGRRNAPLMGQRLAEHGEVPEVIISSPARRARDTAQLVAAAMHYDKSAIHFEPCIYDADVGTLIELIGHLEPSRQDVMLVGHNPGLTDLANLLAPCQINNIVTCGVVKLAFEADSWPDIQFSSGRMLFYDYPGNEHWTSS